MSVSVPVSVSLSASASATMPASVSFSVSLSASLSREDGGGGGMLMVVPRRGWYSDLCVCVALFGATGVPSLVLLEGATGKLISTGGRGILEADPDAAKFPWK